MAYLLFSLKVTFVGLLIVFVGLGILIGMLYIMSAILGSSRKNQKEPEEKPVIEAAPAMETIVEEAAEEEDQGELIAVITAALAAFTENGKTPVVRSVRRAEKASSAWARAGRREILDNRF